MIRSSTILTRTEPVSAFSDIRQLSQNYISRINIVIPAFNEEKTIQDVVSEARKFGEVIVVDDGSTDNTKFLAERAGAKVISHLKNRGYTAALRTGMANASREIIVLLDADKQQRPDEIPALVLPILENRADLVIGSKFIGRLEYKPNIPNFFMDKLICGIFRFRFGIKLTNSYSGFRAMRRNLVNLDYVKGDRHEGTLELNYWFAEKKFKILEVPRTARKRVAGKSSIRIFDGLRIVKRLMMLMIFHDH